MTKQQTIDYLRDQVESLHAALEAKNETTETLKERLESLPKEIEEKQYQNFKESDLAKHVSRYVEELIGDNLKIDGGHEPNYSGYYSLNLRYKDKMISNFDGQICMHRNYLED